MGLPPWAESESQWFVMVTGCNSGLGYSICERTITEHFTTPSRPSTQHLVLIVSTRSVSKSRDTIASLRKYLRNFAQKSKYAVEEQVKILAEGKAYSWKDTVRRVHFLNVELDLCDLRGLYAAARKIKGEDGGLGCPGAGEGQALQHIQIPRLDVLVLNAGIIEISGIRWGSAVWDVITDTKEAVTWWEHNIAVVGSLLKPQRETSGVLDGNVALVEGKSKEPPMGKTFCANVFGHYVLAHELMALLSNAPDNDRSPTERGRIIWLSSIEALDDSFSSSDLQGLQAIDPYRSAKRLTDILALTADLPAVRQISAPWFAITSSSQSTPAKSTRSKAKSQESPDSKPGMYITHPGICHTTIVQLPLILAWCKLLSFFLARWLGSVWHPIWSYKGAVAPTWLILSPQKTLDDLEFREGGRAKWGSSSDWWGEERVRKTWVDGWGLTGQVGVEGDYKRKGIKRGAIDLTREAREDFEAEGRMVWGEMEALRLQWESILKA